MIKAKILFKIYITYFSNWKLKLSGTYIIPVPFKRLIVTSRELIRSLKNLNNLYVLVSKCNTFFIEKIKSALHLEIFFSAKRNENVAKKVQELIV